MTSDPSDKPTSGVESGRGLTHVAVSQRRLGPLTWTRYYQNGRLVERHWWLAGWVFARPAHPDGFVSFSERYGYRKAWHVFGGCLSRRKVLR